MMQPESDEPVLVRLTCAICGGWFARLLSPGMARWYKANPDVWYCAIHDPVNCRKYNASNWRRGSKGGKKKKP